MLKFVKSHRSTEFNFLLFKTNFLSIKKDKVNNIIATYTKSNPIQENQLPKIIDGILSKLPKTK